MPMTLKYFWARALEAPETMTTMKRAASSKTPTTKRLQYPSA